MFGSAARHHVFAGVLTNGNGKPNVRATWLLAWCFAAVHADCKPYFTYLNSDTQEMAHVSFTKHTNLAVVPNILTWTPDSTNPDATCTPGENANVGDLCVWKVEESNWTCNGGLRTGITECISRNCQANESSCWLVGSRISEGLPHCVEGMILTETEGLNVKPSVWMIVLVCSVLGMCATCYCCLSVPEDEKEDKSHHPATAGSQNTLTSKSTLLGFPWMTASGLSMLSKHDSNQFKFKSSLGVDYTYSEMLSAAKARSALTLSKGSRKSPHIPEIGRLPTFDRSMRQAKASKYKSFQTTTPDKVCLTMSV